MRLGFGILLATALAAASAAADEGAAARIVALSEASGGAIYVVTAERGGLYRSDDRGRSWTPEGSELPPTFLDGVTTLGDATVVVAGHAGAFRSSDGGISWTQFSAVPVMRIWPARDGALLVRPWNAPLFRVADGRVSILRQAGDRLMDVRSLPDGHLIGARFGHGVVHSHDGGKTWRTDSEGLVNRDLLSVVALPSGTLVAGTFFGGAFRRGSGTVWEQASRGLPANATVQVLAVLPDGRVLAGTHGDGLFLSTDEARSWHKVAAGDEALATITAILPLGGEDALAGTWGAGVRMVRLDRGSSRPAALRTAVAAVAEDDAGTVYALLDNGAVMAAAVDGAPFSPRGKVPAATRSLLATGDGRVLAGTASGLSLSEDGGRMWRSVAGPDGPVAGLADAGHGVLLAAMAKGDVLQSGDGGLSWQPLELGTPAEEIESVSTLVSDRMGYVVLGTDDGFLASKDFGKSWHAFPVSYGAGAVALGCNGGTFVARWMSAGLFRQPDPLGEEFEAVDPWNEFDVRAGPLACARDGTLIAVGRGVSRIVPADEAWKAEEASLANAVVRSLLVRRNGTLLAATDQGLFASADDARSWANVPVAR